MHEGATRSGVGPGGAFSPLTLGTLITGAGAEVGDATRLFQPDNPPYVGLGNEVYLYIFMTMLEPRDPAGQGLQDVKFIDIFIRYAMVAPLPLVGSGIEPRFPAKTGPDPFPTQYFYRPEIVPERGVYRDTSTPAVQGYTPPKQATIRKWIRWPSYRINNPADPQYAPPFGISEVAIPLIAEVAAGDQIDAWVGFRCADESQTAILRVGERVQAGVCFGGEGRG